MVEKILKGIYFEPDVLKDLYLAMKSRSEGSPYGLLSRIVNDAVRMYLKTLQSTEGHIEKSKTIEGCEKVMGNLEGKGFQEKAGLDDIKRSIYQVHGHDPRTIRRWLRPLHSLGYIKPDVGNIWALNHDPLGLDSALKLITMARGLLVRAWGEPKPEPLPLEYCKACGEALLNVGWPEDFEKADE